jgi:hypothetical protein
MVVAFELTFSDHKDIVVRLLETYSSLIHTDIIVVRLLEMYSSLIHTDIIVRRLPRMKFRFLSSGFSIGVSFGYSKKFHPNKCVRELLNIPMLACYLARNRLS